MADTDQALAFEPVPGIRLGTACAGIKKPGRRDLVVMELAPHSQSAAVFTRNAFCAAPVTVAREHLQQAAPRYLLINTGNANAGTGAAGLADARQCCAALAEQVGCQPHEVLPFSTGVIGEPLPVTRITGGLPAACAALSEAGWHDAAYGILTTDTVPKLVSRRLELDGRPITVTGMAKGSGMIRPDMATMLAYIATDAAVDQPLLQNLLQQAVDRSFNRITVDGDTSTNDACLLVATGASGLQVTADSEAAHQLGEAVAAVCIELARAIVRDGEGATKLINIVVNGGRDEAECLAVAYTLAHSPLVKTAFFASDPNWGRLLAAVGRAGVAELDVERVRLWLDDVLLAEAGGRAASYTEEQGQWVMQQPEITVTVDLQRGEATATVWTCDFSYDYVRINAEYRT
ncbi:MAG: bifunctional glutamate N-acetyltransferase/amino-acid acetyltransferase ArgJ [Thiohalophilus sp.]|uniref:bifunctional glutamate N-acetyltransferase/amino-acid acetyltransferase ArgJ n=1 Tax=Thiohalophilus sp. TaxID=3028392 RepID=UPI00286FC369|nr:bifunctional glutamate N-acetyltransferase/amino-acid acetyltransferase ArgJ [Thiohalophilus sp.]MDR9435739.1 bifunctional glutamate N-acetyltransferase/amino-acid acetyltransferase ArgJ [Thiohalophilus sp.]